MADQVLPIGPRPTAFPTKLKDFGDGSYGEYVYAVLANAFGGDPLPAGEAHLGRVGGESAVAGASFSRPANTTAYSIGDLVADNVTAGSVTPITIAAARINAGTGSIVRCRLSTNKTGLAGTEVFRVHLFKNAPTVANGDNGVFLPAGIAAIHLGYFEITLESVFSDGAKGIAMPAVGSQIVFDAGAGTQNIFALIEARTTYTPASGETFTVALEVLRD